METKHARHREIQWTHGEFLSKCFVGFIVLLVLLGIWFS
jgi:hypothetical protein